MRLHECDCGVVRVHVRACVRACVWCVCVCLCVLSPSVSVSLSLCLCLSLNLSLSLSLSPSLSLSLCVCVVCLCVCVRACARLYGFGWACVSVSVRVCNRRSADRRTHGAKRKKTVDTRRQTDRPHRRVLSNDQHTHTRSNTAGYNKLLTASATARRPRPSQRKRASTRVVMRRINHS
jgi:hypothetical protein